MKRTLLYIVVEADHIVFDYVLCGLKEQDVRVSFWKFDYAVAWLHVKVLFGVFNPSPYGFQRRVALTGEGLRVDADFLTAMCEEKQVAHLVLHLCHHLPALSACDHLSVEITQDGALAEGLGCNNSCGQKEGVINVLSMMLLYSCFGWIYCAHKTFVHTLSFLPPKILHSQI